MSATCRFLPRLVVGFPGLVIDRPQASAGVIPTHFLGMITSLQHSVSQGGGQTFVSYSHARSHRTGKGDMDDLFSRTLYEKGQLFSTQFTGQETTEIDLEEELGSGAVYREGPTGLWRADASYTQGTLVTTGKPENVPVVVFALQWLEDHSAPGEVVLRIGAQDIPPGLRGPKGKAVGGIEIRGDSLAASATSSSGVKFTTLRVSEHDAGILPLEEALRPPWFSDQYSNKNIGTEIYQKFFGTESIMDIAPSAGTLEEAVDEIVRTYSSISRSGPLPGYVWFTTYRAGASLPDVLLREGDAFHYFAGGNYDGLKGLDLIDGKNERGQQFALEGTNSPSTYVLVSPISGKPHPIDREIDPRKGRYAAVASYVSELRGQRAFRG